MDLTTTPENNYQRQITDAIGPETVCDDHKEPQLSGSLHILTGQTLLAEYC